MKIIFFFTGIFIFLISCGKDTKETINYIEIEKRKEVLKYLNDKEKKVLDWINKTISYGSISFYPSSPFSLHDNNSYSQPYYLESLSMEDGFDFIFADINYKIIDNKVIYCQYYQNKCEPGGSCTGVTDPDCNLSLYATCILKIELNSNKPRCFKDIEVDSNGRLTGFKISANGSASKCIRKDNQSAIPSKENCTNYFSIPDGVDFFIRFQISTDGKFQIYGHDDKMLDYHIYKGESLERIH